MNALAWVLTLIGLHWIDVLFFGGFAGLVVYSIWSIVA